MRVKCILSLFVFLILTAGLILPAASAGKAESGKCLTLMVYMCGSNLESGSGAATDDLFEMANSGYDFKNVNLLVMTGGTSQWMMGLPSDALCVYQPGRGQLRMLYAFEDMSMGSADALTALLDYGYECCPAGEYALILWDHGGGPLNGLCWDERYDGDHLTMEELCRALGQSPAAQHRLSWIGFDACLMASAEVGSLIMPYARYMIASQETEPGTGWNYSFLKDIHLDQDGAATGRRIVDSYFDGAEDQKGLTLSLTDLDALTDLTAAADEMFSGIEISGGNYARYSYAARQTRAYGKAAVEGSGYDLIDLGTLIRELSSGDPQAAETAEAALQKAVIYSRSGDGLSEGLSVYHPYQNKSEFVSRWAELYPLVGFSEGYEAYVERFAAYLFGQQAVSWTGLQALPTNEASMIALPLSEEQISMTAEAVVDLLQWDQDAQAYSPAGMVTSLEMYDGVLFACLSGQVLCAIDDEGHASGGPIPYSLTGENRMGVYVNFCTSGAENTEEAIRTVPVDTSAERKSGIITFSSESSSGTNQGTVSTSGSEAADTWAAQTVSLNDALSSQMNGTLNLVAPKNAAALQLVNIPVSLSEAFGQTNTSISMVGLPLSVVPEGSFNDITPVPFPGGGGSIQYTGGGVPLSSFVSINVESFDPAVTVIEMSAYQPKSPASEQEMNVIHAWIEYSVTEDGRTTEPRVWIYDEAKDRWGRGEFPDRNRYPVSVFPKTWAQPMADTDGGLHGTESWLPVRNDAACRVTGVWSLEFAPREDETLCAAFRLTDTQNRRHESMPVLLSQTP